VSTSIACPSGTARIWREHGTSTDTVTAPSAVIAGSAATSRPNAPADPPLSQLRCLASVGNRTAGACFRSRSPEASIFVSHYRRIRDLGFSCQESLIDGYQRYRGIAGADPCISFDRAFNLVCHLDAVWTVRERAFDLNACPHCDCRYLVPVGDPSYIDECVFCKFVQRYPVDPRLQSRFPARPLPDLSSVAQSLRMLAYLGPR
jgi:hypothetical protein